MKKSKQPTVAIVTRTKNRNILLERALESVAAQEYKDFVHVVVNDGGNAKAVESIVSKFSHNIKLIHNTKSVGLTKALNQGVQAVNSEYISILDDDDTWSSKFLSSTIKRLEESHNKGVVVVLDKIVETIVGGTVKILSQSRWRPDIRAVSLYGQCIDNYAPTVAFVYSRSVYDELDGYDEELGVSEDWEFTLRFLLKYDVDFLNTKDALAFYHHRPEVKGDIGNSVFYGVDRHEYQMNMLANKLLRKDVVAGRFGVGYIVNSLRYNRNTLIPQQAEKDFENTARLETQINNIQQQLHALGGVIERTERNNLGNIIGVRLRRLLRRSR